MNLKIIINCISFAFFLIFIIGLGTQIVKGEIIMDKAPPDFAIIDYKIISSNITDNVLYLGFQIFAKNRGNQPIYNVKVLLTEVLQNVTIYKGEITYPKISSQEAMLSSDLIEISINNYKQIDILPFSWNVEYDDAKGRHQKGEIIINYKRYLLYPLYP